MLVHYPEHVWSWCYSMLLGNYNVTNVGSQMVALDHVTVIDTTIMNSYIMYKAHVIHVSKFVEGWE
jgi:hypothetical protein